MSVIDLQELKDWVDELPVDGSTILISDKISELISQKLKVSTPSDFSRIRRAIDRIGRKDICLKTGISYPQMSAWLSGAGYLSKEKKKSLSRVIGVDI